MGAKSLPPLISRMSIFMENPPKFPEWLAKYFTEENIEKFSSIQDNILAQALPSSCSKALMTLISSATSYLCETGFSVRAVIKRKSIKDQRRDENESSTVKS